MQLEDPFGVAVSSEGTIYVADGEQGRIYRISPNGETRVITDGLATPSAIALAPDGSLIVAETGAHAILRIDTRTGAVQLVVGQRGRPGFEDGMRERTLFSAPIGIAVASDGTIYVADSYNDRIRVVNERGEVRTVAGGETGFADGAAGAEVRFHTPCGIALLPDGSLVVADTGNNRLRRVEPNGATTTLSGTGEAESRDGPLDGAAFDEPIGIVATREGAVYVADAGSGAIREVRLPSQMDKKDQGPPRVTTIAGSGGSGFLDGPLSTARFRRPSGLAVAPDGSFVVADAGNKLLRVLVGEGRLRGTVLPPEESPLARWRRAVRQREHHKLAHRWPFDPPDRAREIAATFGEIRGLVAADREAWFHNGLDVPGALGETVRLLRTERVLLPLAVQGFGTARERIRFPLFGYVHLRVGRDRQNRPFADDRCIFRRDERGEPTDLRVPRGAVFTEGEALGTLNEQYHVHLIAGPIGAEANALSVIELPRVQDARPPVISRVRIVRLSGEEIALLDDGAAKRRNAPSVPPERVRIVVECFDQMDGNAARRRLGIYRLGYQLLDQHAKPVQGFEQPLLNIAFDVLPDDARAVQIAYAQGSNAGYGGETVFAYQTTNIVRDGEAREDFFDATALPAGAYLLRIIAEDFFGNRTTRDFALEISAHKTGPDGKDQASEDR